MNGVLSMPAEAYHAASGVSKSMLDYIAPPEFTPAHYRARFLTGEMKKEETDAMRLGSLTHRCILEPDTVAGAFHVRPEEMSFTTKEGKAWKAEHMDKPIVKSEEAKAVNAMCAAIWRHPMAKRLLVGDKERSLFAQDGNGTLRKGRLDVLCAGNIVPDLKTCQTTERGKLEKEILEYRYHVQGAYYTDLCNLLGYEKQVFVLICVEKTPPYDVVCYQIEPEILELGRKEYRANLATLRHCLEKDEWPGRSNEIETIGLPHWAMKQLERDSV